MLNKQSKTASRGYERVLFLIEWAAAQTEAITLTDTVNHFGWPKSTTHLLLQSLVSFGYMKQLPNQGYVLIRLPGEPTTDNVLWGSLLRIALPHLTKAVQIAQETGCIAVLTDKLKLRYLNKALPDREIRYDRNIEIERIPHQVASGIVLLSGFSAEQLQHYIETYNLTNEKAVQLQEQINEARQLNYVYNTRGTVEGAAGIASPILGRTGQIIAAVNISGPKERVDKNQTTIIEATQQAAIKISQHF